MTNENEIVENEAVAETPVTEEVQAEAVEQAPATEEVQAEAVETPAEQPAPAEENVEPAPVETPAEQHAQAEAPAPVEQASEQPVAEEPAQETAPAEQPAPTPRDTSGKRWYILHVYSTFEQKVANHINEQAKLKGQTDKIGEIKVPTVTAIDVKGGKKVEKEMKLFPGYILINMEMSEESWHLVSSAPKVTGFLGSGKRPSPISDAEVAKLLQQMEDGVAAPVSTISYEIGEAIRVIDGPFAGFNGSVEEVDMDRARLKVTVKVFERDTLCDVEFKQVEKLN